MHRVIENFMVKMIELLEASTFRPPEFFGEIEQEIKAELFLEQLNDIYDILKYDDAKRVTGSRHMDGIADRTVIQRKVATGPAAPPYKRPGQGPWKLGDFKRP
ncbi:hypothetical protein M9H77_34723 [Catharanthus roseus]|uniref:Uncharacterized protein n=1 Tax=Catharanthus roseus TaxID=4058 RepID=A0ACB9ZMP7_CATRO|nr:hypothetical protein M9H77_34723 [Catharanthus roseus]